MTSTVTVVLDLEWVLQPVAELGAVGAEPIEIAVDLDVDEAAAEAGDNSTTATAASDEFDAAADSGPDSEGDVDG